MGAKAEARAGNSSENVSHDAVLARAKKLRISERTLRRYVGAGLVARPSRGPGATYPPAVLAQLDALGSARRRTHSLVKLRHWLWWEGLPVSFEDWRQDRIPELEALASAFKRLDGMTEDRLDREAADQARFWKHRRPWRHRQRRMRTDKVRQSLAAWMLTAATGGELPNPEQPYSGIEGERPRVGEVMERAFGWVPGRPSTIPGRASGWPGGDIREMLRILPRPEALPEGFRLLTEVESKQLRDLLKAVERHAAHLLNRPLREKPELAAAVMVSTAVVVVGQRNRSPGAPAAS